MAVTEREEREVQVDAELLGEIGGSPESVRALLAQLRIRSFPDWAGRECVTARDARRVVETWRKRQEEHARLLAEYDFYLRDFNRRRQAAWDEAYEKTAESELAAQYTTPFEWGSGGRGWAEGGVRTTNTLNLWRSGRARARNAAREALERFDKREPRPLIFDEWERKRGGRR